MEGKTTTKTLLHNARRGSESTLILSRQKYLPHDTLKNDYRWNTLQCEITFLMMWKIFSKDVISIVTSNVQEEDEEKCRR